MAALEKIEKREERKRRERERERGRPKKLFLEFLYLSWRIN